VGSSEGAVERRRSVAAAATPAVASCCRAAAAADDDARAACLIDGSASVSPSCVVRRLERQWRQQLDGRRLGHDTERAAEQRTCGTARLLLAWCLGGARSSAMCARGSCS